MQIMPVNNVINPRYNLAFGDRDDWGGNGPDPWDVERRELGDEYLRKKQELDLKFDRDEISLSRYSCKLKELKKWLKDGEAEIAEKWHKRCINYKPPKKNFFQKLFRI